MRIPPAIAKVHSVLISRSSPPVDPSLYGLQPSLLFSTKNGRNVLSHKNCVGFELRYGGEEAREKKAEAEGMSAGVYTRRGDADILYQ